MQHIMAGKCITHYVGFPVSGICGTIPSPRINYARNNGAVADQTVRNFGNGGIKQNWVAPALVLFSDDADAVKLLLDHGADVNGRDEDGDTALLLACGVSNFARPGPEIVKLLLAYHADVNAKDKRGTTPLIAAARHGRLDIVRLLLAAHANINAVDQNGISALQYAVNGEYEEVVRVFRARGVR
jgi:ankyrin repeat protein